MPLDVLQADRATFIGGSDVTRVAKGEGHQVWLEKTKRAEPEDLSRVFRVQLGKFTENFILDWAETELDIEIGDRQQFINADPERPWLAATIDGASIGSPYGGHTCVFEAKHSNQWATDQTIFDYYYWQVQHQAWAGGFDDGAIPYIAGNNWGGVVEIEIDPFKYQAEMLPKLEQLWQCIVDDVPYEDPEKVATPPLDGLITYDLSSPDQAAAFNWGPEAIEKSEAICRDKKVAERFEDLKKELRKLVPDDARMVKLPTLSVRRAKTGTLSVHFAK